ncbi:hypothetical protein QWY77_11840 [Thalassotalea ponticola]|uniref:hypothetical protein n=1 Tax=Thalassotalea ponticola TaxID=1523392 RepID=UPI0025B2B2E3|nr:hypothetical protein [Thalassotalea ponticola]MDN3653434.1 hypothetical protein [Thalassotalea ponticola]
MDLEEKDKGVIAVILKRFETERLPKVKKLQAKVDAGGVLDEYDIDFLEQVFDDAHQVMDVVKRHPEYSKLAKGILQMYNEIMAKSQANSN